MNSLSCREADILMFSIMDIPGVESVKVYERTFDAAIVYSCDREDIIEALKRFSFEKADVPENLLENSGRALNAEYQEKLVNRIIFHYGKKYLIPAPIRHLHTLYKACKYVWLGLKCLFGKRKLEVPVLDAAAIGVSIIRNDFPTASSVMFLLDIGELLEEWTHKKSVDDLARTMALNVGNVWIKTEDNEVLLPVSDVKEGDTVIVRQGSVIPFDGSVSEGEAMINQAALTGESLPVRRTEGASVYAGTIVDEGEICIKVKNISGGSRYERIVRMIEDSEKLKSEVEGKALHLADSLVPYTFLATALTWAVTRNVTKAVSVLMVDYSCALKLAMPVSVLSAIREAGTHHITVKGGKFLEAVAEAKTIVFDKTGTLTKAKPTVKSVVPFIDYPEDELLRLAACLEEHFPHSMAKAVVDAARIRGLEHEEKHSKVEYIVAHGIASAIENKRVIIGSYHFVFEDENCKVPEGKEDAFDSLSPEYSHLYMAIDGTLAAVILIEDPLRPEAGDVVKELREAGFERIVMMTGDSERTAKSIAERVGVDKYFSEVLPEDKAAFIDSEKAAGRRVVMVGDGINDSPALSAADVGIAISEGAEIAREVADITIGADDLHKIIVLKNLSQKLMKRMNSNYRVIVGFNTGLIALGIAGLIQPTTSALLHNTSTIAIGVKSMTNLLE